MLPFSGLTSVAPFPQILRPQSRVSNCKTEQFPIRKNKLHFVRRVRKIVKTDYWLRYVCLSVRPHGTTRLTLDGFSRNFTCGYLSKICPENSNFIKTGQK